MQSWLCLNKTDSKSVCLRCRYTAFVLELGRWSWSLKNNGFCRSVYRNAHCSLNFRWQKDFPIRGPSISFFCFVCLCVCVCVYVRARALSSIVIIIINMCLNSISTYNCWYHCTQSLALNYYYYYYCGEGGGVHCFWFRYIYVVTLPASISFIPNLDGHMLGISWTVLHLENCITCTNCTFSHQCHM